MNTLDNYLSVLNEGKTLESIKNEIGNLLKKKDHLKSEADKLKEKLATPRYKDNPVLKIGVEQQLKMNKREVTSLRAKIAEKMKDYNSLKDVVNKAKEEAVKAKEVVSKNPEKLPSLVPYILGGLAIAAALALIIFASNKIYKRYLSKHARACSGLKGKSKTICILTSQLNALKAQQNSLKKSVTFCKKSQNPQKCKSKLNKKLLKINKRISKSSTRLKELR
ncbi:MAG: hypothetical protein PVG65_06205 [Candidatus Thorarchaeota archaeon]|jgi:hypothetical protein